MLPTLAILLLRAGHMKKKYMLILCGLIYPLFAMDGTNIFEIDSDELRELKEIANSLDSPVKTAQQEQKESFEINKPEQTKPELVSKKTFPIQNKKEYICPGCKGIYYQKGWFARHVAKCILVKT